MRLLHLIEQDHAIRLAPYRFGQAAALLVADIARRRTDQAGDGVFLHELAHVDADQVILGIEHELGQRLAQLGLADAGRAEEQEGTIRPVRIRQAGARTANRVADQADRLVLTHYAFVQFFFHVEQLVALALHHLADRDTGRAADHFGDFFGTHMGAQQLFFLRVVSFVMCGFGRLELRFSCRSLPYRSSATFSSLPSRCRRGDLRP